jgi:uncharacterized protein
MYTYPQSQSWSRIGIRDSPFSVTLRWVWNHPEVTVVLSGMNEETHIQENLTVAGQAYPDSLTEAELQLVKRVELQLVKRVETKYRELMKVGCTGCRYCMPCPSGLKIPLCFDVKNKID